MYEFLLSSDFMVPDPDATTALLVAKLGVREHPRWRQAFPNHSYIAWFLRAHPSLAVAPTRLETQGHRHVDNPSDPCFQPFLQSLIDFQGAGRPMKTHALVLITRRFDELVEKLMRRRLPFRIAPRSDEMPFDRLWVGVTPENPRYSPCVDGGLVIEVLPVEPLQMPAETFSTPPPEPREPKPGDMVRIVSRGILVRDLDETLRLLSTNLNWEPAGPITTVEAEGTRIARMRFGLAHSASVDLIEPYRGDREAGAYLNVWGPGPYYTRISVTGLDAKAEDLRKRGTRFAVVESASAPRGRALRVDPRDLDGIRVEFVEHMG
ncbi:MAG: VOC family protein [Candidatus Binatia bacterium]